VSNPAKVLHGHFVAVRALTDRTWTQAWESVLGVPWTDSVGPLLSLVDDTRALLGSRPRIDPTPLLLHEGEWRRAIILHSVRLDMPIGNSNFLLSDDDMSGLYAVSAILGSYADLRGTVTADSLKTISDAIAKLRESITEATDLDDELRIFLVQTVNDMQSRIDLSRIVGTGPLERLPQDILGSSGVHANLFTRMRASSVWKDFVGVMVAVSMVSTTVTAAYAAIESTHSVIEQLFDHPQAQLPASPIQKELPPGHS
jgi:hypothetical protein